MDTKVISEIEVRLEHLTIESDEFRLLVYHQTGMDLEDFTGRIVSKMVASPWVDIKYRYDRPIQNLRFIRSRGIPILIKNIEEDGHLRKMSPPLFDWYNTQKQTP